MRGVDPRSRSTSEGHRRIGLEYNPDRRTSQGALLLILIEMSHV